MEKRTSLPVIIIAFILGFGLCYLLIDKIKPRNNAFTDDNGMLTKDAKDFIKKLYTDSTFKPERGHSHHIGNIMARKLIREFQKQNQGGMFPLLNVDGQPLKGYYIDRGPLDTILADKSLAGISVYFAKDSTTHANGKNERIYTLVYMGAKINAGGMTPYSNNTFNNLGDSTVAYDFISPCPDACGNYDKVADPKKASKKH